MPDQAIAVELNARDLIHRVPYFGVNSLDNAPDVTSNSKRLQLLNSPKNSVMEFGQVPFQFGSGASQNAIAVSDKLSLESPKGLVDDQIGDPPGSFRLGENLFRKRSHFDLTRLVTNPSPEIAPGKLTQKILIVVRIVSPFLSNAEQGLFRPINSLSSSWPIADDVGLDDRTEYQSQRALRLVPSLLEELVRVKIAVFS
jgi:hypothetical protein